MVKLKEKVNFAGHNIYVGMDVHLKSWSICIVYERNFVRRFSQPPNVESLCTTLNREFPGATFYAAYEAGFCGFGIQRELSKRGVSCMVVNAADIPKSDKEKKNKTDSMDAKSLADNLASGKLTAIHVPGEKVESDRQLVRCRLSVLRDLQRTKNRIKSALYFKGISIPDKFDNANWSKAFIQWLKDIQSDQGSSKIMLGHMIAQLEWQRTQLLNITRDARAMLKEADYDAQAQLLLSVPGIGPLNAVTILTEVGDIKRFYRAQRFNSFLGLCPTQHSTGENELKGGLTIRCNDVLRSMIIEAAWVAVRHDPALMIAFENYKKKGMTSKRAIVKIAHKLCNRIYYVLYHKVPYEKGIVK